MSEVKFGKKNLPHLLYGTSPFIGAGQFGLKGQEWYHRFFNHPDRMSDLFNYFCELGFAGAHIIGYSTIVKAGLLTKKNYPLRIAVSLLPDDWEKNLEEVSVLEPDIIFVHGAMTDNFLKKRASELLSCFQAIRDHDAYPGLATHNSCQTLRAIHDDSNPLSKEKFGFLLPINSLGWSMGGSISELVDLLNKIDNYPLMAMKTLAAGRLSPQEAIKFVFETPKVQIAAIGMTNKEEISEIATIGKTIINKISTY